MPARCPECSAHYESDADSCAARFDELLALDHSRREPWGSRHGLAFAAYALQHPVLHSASLDAAWSGLYRVYCLGEPVFDVFAALRGAKGRVAGRIGVPRRPSVPAFAPTMTIADMGDFAAATYAERLEEWCRASLRAWGAPLDAR